MTEYSKKILVLADGSERSLKTVQYLCNTLPPDGFQVVLFHVFDPVPECYWDLENQPKKKDAIRQLRSWEEQKRKHIENFMENARTLFVNSGFDPSSAKIKIRNRQAGIARDIVKEAETGYGAVAMARHGFGALVSFSMGSVASKLFSKIGVLPLIIVGDAPLNKKILLAVDGSESSEKMAEFVGSYIGGPDHEVVLFHVIRGFDAVIPECPDLKIPMDRFELARMEMETFFDGLKEKLVRAGLEPAKISEKIVSGEFSRAGAIVREAKENGCSAIAVGRRGISNVEAFLLGRVSNKVIHGGSHHTVWVV